MKTIIRFEHVHYHYTAGQPVLRDIHLSISQGESIALIGGNGSGKTTLAKHCNGLYKPTSGRVYVDGQDTRSLSVSALSSTVSYCYQNPDHQIFQSTIRDEVAFGPINLGLPQEEVESRVAEALTAVGLYEMRAEEPYFAGKGERQKIAVASVLAMKPQVIVLDEPTTGLDHRGVEEMMSLIERLNRKGHTIVMVTHDMRLVARYAHRVLVLKQGRIIEDGSPEEVFAKPEVLAVAQVEPPAVTRLALGSVMSRPLPLTLNQLQLRVQKDKI
ncbi:energy-coupling factor ABC transporter ATP-binding protein [Paenibacillus sp. J2TS4]|uniref:energy-coupling factor ABC transporter ATP-binding protein n=1 Tax=Paenibacillus sp. J2TS4 TaxID=2807194 RepID=UPI001B1E744A|nr:energy-coupling factor ABC transporter ATP-binding protein [Paenibacillus sp. J2TS4]GIP31215.1 hypothetical protein J2TS4_04250 [Paenibacillus sp. J2TS4]